jgi:hypothetical protein
MQQRDRIRTSRQGDKDTIAGTHQGMLRNRAPDALGERHDNW